MNWTIICHYCVIFCHFLSLSRVLVAACSLLSSLCAQSITTAFSRIFVCSRVHLGFDLLSFVFVCSFFRRSECEKWRRKYLSFPVTVASSSSAHTHTHTLWPLRSHPRRTHCLLIHPLAKRQKKEYVSPEVIPLGGFFFYPFVCSQNASSKVGNWRAQMNRKLINRIFPAFEAISAIRRRQYFNGFARLMAAIAVESVSCVRFARSLFACVQFATVNHFVHQWWA